MEHITGGYILWKFLSEKSNLQVFDLELLNSQLIWLNN